MPYTVYPTFLVGGFNHVLFSPLFGEDSHILTNIFQMGWFNHQLAFPRHDSQTHLGYHQRYSDFGRNFMWFPSIRIPFARCVLEIVRTTSAYECFIAINGFFILTGSCWFWEVSSSFPLIQTVGWMSRNLCRFISVLVKVLRRTCWEPWVLRNTASRKYRKCIVHTICSI